MLKKIIKKDYNSILEEILEKNAIEENAKNLLQGILYKIEVSYDDYKTVKRINKTEEQYVQEIINSIEKKCKQIKIVNLSDKTIDEKVKQKLDKNGFCIKNGLIISYPIERKLLYAVEKRANNQKIVNNRYENISISLSNLINRGRDIDRVEVLRDFNGWSWSTLKREIEDIDANLIFQTLSILMGEDFIEGWCEDLDGIIDYIQILNEELKEKYKEDIQKSLYKILKKLSIVIEYNINENFKNIIDKEIKNTKKELELFEDKQQFIVKMTKEKKKYVQQIGKIEKIVANKEKLQEEYYKRNETLELEKKIFSMKVLKQMLLEEKAELLKKIENINMIMMPQNFVKKQEEIKEKLEIFDIENMEKSNLMIEFQKLFLKCFKKKIEEEENIIDLIYKFRYYLLLPVNDKQEIKDVVELKNDIDEVIKALNNKAKEQKKINLISENDEINRLILENILKIRTINLEDLYLEVKKEKNQYYAQLLDENVSEERFEIPKEKNIKTNKKIKIFN